MWHLTYKEEESKKQSKLISQNSPPAAIQPAIGGIAPTTAPGKAQKMQSLF